MREGNRRLIATYTAATDPQPQPTAPADRATATATHRQPLTKTRHRPHSHTPSRAPTPKDSRSKCGTDPGMPTGQQGQPFHSTTGRKGNRRAGAAGRTAPSQARNPGRNRAPPPLQAPKTDSTEPSTERQPEQMRPPPEPFAAVVTRLFSPLPQLLAVSQEPANTPPNPQQENPAPPQTQHPYFEAVESILSRIFPRLDKLSTKPKKTAHNPQRTPQNR